MSFVNTLTSAGRSFRRSAASSVSPVATPGIAPSGGGFFSSFDGLGDLLGQGGAAVANNAIRQGFASLNDNVGGGQPLPSNVDRAPSTNDRDVSAFAVPVGIALAAMLGLVVIFKLVK